MLPTFQMAGLALAFYLAAITSLLIFYDLVIKIGIFSTFFFFGIFSSIYTKKFYEKKYESINEKIFDGNCIKGFFENFIVGFNTFISVLNIVVNY